MKNYGQITEDKDIINKKYADTLDASSLHKSGDEVAEGQKTFNGKVLIKNLTLNTEIPWTFEQSDTGAKATLDLKSHFDGKMFRITSPLKTKGICISVSETSDNNWVAPITDNVTDLGRNSYQWRNLYIKGNISDGTNKMLVSEIVNFNKSFEVTEAGKYGKVFKSGTLASQWDTITVFLQFMDKNSNNLSRELAGYIIQYKGQGAGQPKLTIHQIYGNDAFSHCLYVDYVSAAYSANANYFEIYYKSDYTGDDSRAIQVLNYQKRSAGAISDYTVYTGTLTKLDSITSIGTTKKFADLNIKYYTQADQAETITGAWKFNNISAENATISKTILAHNGTITDTLNASIFKFGSAKLDGTNQGGSIELGSTTEVSTPFIDFHTDGNSNTDYNVRLLAQSNFLDLTAAGGFKINGGLINYNISTDTFTI
jgi:hypothetical protein